jgi:hypothetical protein
MSEFHDAAREGDVATVRQILQRDNVDINTYVSKESIFEKDIN